jgi:hypothetical protein
VDNQTGSLNFPSGQFGRITVDAASDARVRARGDGWLPFAEALQKLHTARPKGIEVNAKAAQLRTPGFAVFSAG